MSVRRLGTASGGSGSELPASLAIDDGYLTTSHLADGAVTSAKIADGTIATGDIADGAITSAKILDATIATGDIADAAISTAKIADGAVTAAKIADGAIVNAEISASAAIDYSKLAAASALSVLGRSANSSGANASIPAVNDGEVLRRSGTALGFGTVATLGIADAAVTTAKIADAAITSAKIADGTIVTADIADAAVTSAKIADGAITSAKILDGAIVNADISASAAIDQSKIANLATDLAGKANSRLTINPQTTSYTLASNFSDANKVIEISSASAVTLTIPADTTADYPIGTQFSVLQSGAGTVSVAGASGVTVNGWPGLRLRAQWASATVYKRGANLWVVVGNLMA